MGCGICYLQKIMNEKELEQLLINYAKQNNISHTVEKDNKTLLDTFIDKVTNWFEKWQKWYQVKMCKHLENRPATVKEKPAEICKVCDRVQLLSPQDYYAKYGELGWRDWK